MLCDGTLLVASTCVAELFPDASLEETFTTLTTNDAVVTTYNYHHRFTVHMDLQKLLGQT